MPTAQSGFELFTTLVFPDRHTIAQGFTFETHSGDIYATQDDGSRQYITRFDLTDHADSAAFLLYTPLEQCAVLAGGHGDLTFDVELVDGEIRPSFIDHDGTLWRIPFTDGNVRLTGKPLARGWKLPIRGYDGTVLVRRTVRTDREGRIFHFYGPDPYNPVTAKGQGTAAALKAATDRLFRTKNYGWIQGYAYHLGTLYTLRGAPRVEGGRWLYDSHVLPYVERRNSPTGRILDPWPVDTLGWVDGEPLDGKVEPEGMTIAHLDGKLYLLVGISTGHKGNYSLQIWRRAL